MSHHSSLFDSYKIRRVRPPKNKIGSSAKHDSAISHVMGTATYVDDILKPQGTLHLAVGKSTHAHARVFTFKHNTMTIFTTDFTLLEAQVT